MRWLILAFCLLGLSVRLPAQGGVIGEIIKRIIMGIDLRIQRQQTQTILLQDAQKQVENIMQETQLDSITGWVQRQKDLYDEYYRELWEVKDALLLYSKVRHMIEQEARLVKACRQVSAGIGRNPFLGAEETGHLLRVVSGILASCVEDANRLGDIITSFSSQMDDGERLGLINALAERIDECAHGLGTCSQQAFLLSIQRAKTEGDINLLKSIYGGN